MESGKTALLARCAGWMCLAFASTACGGRAQSSSGGPELPVGGGAASGSAPTESAGSAASSVAGGGGSAAVASPTATGGSGAAPPSGPSQPGEEPEPPTPVTCAASAPVLQAELLWQDAFPFYGSSNYPFIGFSPDGAELIVPITEFATREGNRSYGAESGELLAPPPPAILSRDGAWSRQLLAAPGVTVNVGSVAEVTSGRALLSLETGVGWPLQVRLSDDGKYLFRLRCEGGLRVERVGIADGEVGSVALGSGDSLCLGNSYGRPGFILPLAVSRANDSAVVGAERRGFALANFDSGTAQFSVAPDSPSMTAERQPNQPLPSDALTLELGPAERTLATIDASGTLRLLSYPALAQSLPDITTAVTSAFARGYVTPRVLAPIAWSPDERYLATADDAHATVVRRACDGSIVATLPAPAPDVDMPNDDQNWAPAFLAFNRQSLALAVLRVNPQFRATVSYYQLSVAAPK
jgi:hypothetical protein